MGTQFRFNTDGSRGIASLLSKWREDLNANRGRLLSPGFQALAVHRFGVWCRHRRGLSGWFANKIYSLAYIFVRNFYSVELPRSAVIGHRLWLPHGTGLILGARAQIGDDCMIRQNVTIGRSGSFEERREGAPMIGHRVKIGPGAVIVGSVTIGDDVRIGPNAVVTMDVPSGASVMARPAGILLRSSHDGAQFAEAETRNPSTVSSKGGRQPVTSPDPDDLKVFIQLVSDLVVPEYEIEPDSSLLSTGIVDSFAVASLLGAVEDEYGVVIDPEEIDVEVFDTPTQMLQFVISKQ